MLARRQSRPRLAELHGAAGAKAGQVAARGRPETLTCAGPAAPFTGPLSRREVIGRMSLGGALAGSAGQCPAVTPPLARRPGI